MRRCGGDCSSSKGYTDGANNEVADNNDQTHGERKREFDLFLTFLVLVQEVKEQTLHGERVDIMNVVSGQECVDCEVPCCC